MPQTLLRVVARNPVAENRRSPGATHTRRLLSLAQPGYGRLDRQSGDSGSECRTPANLVMHTLAAQGYPTRRS